MKTTKFILKILAAIVWYIGAFVLFFKGFSLLVEAADLNKERFVIFWSFVFALFIGILKVKYIFIKSCEKNLKRINELKEPKIWQFYKPSFFLFLVFVISLGAYLSHLSHGNFWFLVSVGTLDLSLSFALFLSSIAFWKNR
ncbi:hypothetical protein [Nitrosophilus labii]|uniref:hypothetical protein n=1 Tax=Nitrosophilus labii TaxID=2706014 RepID=UPI001656D567|nr:hypothetical protein [Nitrosophilus labii]